MTWQAREACAFLLVGSNSWEGRRLSSLFCVALSDTEAEENKPVETDLQLDINVVMCFFLAK